MSAKESISEQDLLDALAASADALAEHQVSYAVIGGMAAGYRAQPRFTKDIDFLLAVPARTLPGLLDTLKNRGFELDREVTIRDWSQRHMAVFAYHTIRIDWLKPVIPAYQHVIEKATLETWLGHPVRVASAEGLILLKLLAARTQDWLDIENLVAARPGNLDIAWIRAEWDSVAAPDDARMARFLALAGTP